MTWYHGDFVVMALCHGFMAPWYHRLLFAKACDRELLMGVGSSGDILRVVFSNVCCPPTASNRKLSLGVEIPGTLFVCIFLTFAVHPRTVIMSC